MKGRNMSKKKNEAFETPDELKNGNPEEEQNIERGISGQRGPADDCCVPVVRHPAGNSRFQAGAADPVSHYFLCDDDAVSHHLDCQEVKDLQDAAQDGS